MKLFLAAIAAITLCCASSEVQAQITLESLMDQAVNLGQPTTTAEPTPTPARPVVAPATSSSQVLPPADPQTNPLGAQLDLLIQEAQGLHPRLDNLETKVDGAIVEVRGMKTVQERSLARLDEFEQRQIANTARVMEVRVEADNALGQLAVAEERLTQSEGTVQQLHGQVAQANQTANAARYEAQRAINHLNRPRLTNLFGLLGTR